LFPSDLANFPKGDILSSNYFAQNKRDSRNVSIRVTICKYTLLLLNYIYFYYRPRQSSDQNESRVETWFPFSTSKASKGEITIKIIKHV